MLMLDVAGFELSRSLTKGRVAIWLVLIAFPVVLFKLVSMANPVTRIEQYGITLYVLIPEVVCLLGLLLWATSAISTEIEGQTWIYLAMRSSGRSTVLLGKYLTAVIWTLSAALIAVTLCFVLVPNIGGFRLWSVLCLLSAISCLAHAGIFLLIGVVFHRRTMLTAVGYTLAIEYGMSMIPALANKFTINYRLRGLLAHWMDWQQARSIAEDVFGEEAASSHLMALAAITLVTVTFAVIYLGRAEYPTQQDG